MIMGAGLNLESPRDRIREELLHATRMGNDAREPVLVNYLLTGDQLHDSASSSAQSALYFHHPFKQGSSQVNLGR